MPKSFMSLADLLRLPTAVEPPEDPLVDAYRRWGIGRGDLEGRAIAKKVTRIWAEWSVPDRYALLHIAERIAEAERLKAAWNPKVTRAAYRRLAGLAVDSARLADSLRLAFPPPWQGNAAEVGRLAADLAAFAHAVLRSTFPDHSIATGVAAEMIERHRTSGKARVPWELLRDLAWLASGKMYEVSERTIRRYSDRRLAKMPTDEIWRKHWPLLRRTGALGRQTSRDAFEALAKTYLARPRP